MLLIGHKLRKIRLLKNIDAKRICTEMEISTAQLSRIENDEIKIGVELVQKFADYFNMPLQDVLSFDDKNTVSNNRNNNVANGGINYGTIQDPAVSYSLLKLILEKVESLENRVKSLENKSASHLANLFIWQEI